MKMNFQAIQSKMGKKYSYSVLIIFSILLFALLYGNVRPTKIDISEGSLANETIRANKTIENRYATAEKQKLAEESVTPAMNFDEKKGSQQVDSLKQLFKLIETTNKDAEKNYQEKVAKAKDGEVVAKTTLEEKVANLKKEFEKLSQDDILFYQSFSTTFYENMLSLSETEFSEVTSQSLRIVGERMKEHIRTTNLEEEREEADDEVRNLPVSEKEKSLILMIVNKGIVVNEAINEEKTKELKRTAREETKPVMIYQGEEIIREGVQIDKNAMQKLEILGMTSGNSSVFPVLALVLLILLQLAVLIYLVKQLSEYSMKQQALFFTFYAVLFLVDIFILKFLHIFQSDAWSYVLYLFPAAFTPLVLTLFISRRVGIMASIFQVVFSLFVFHDMVGTSGLLMTTIFYTFAGLTATLLKKERIGKQLNASLIWLVVFPLALSVILIIFQGLQFDDSKTWSILVCSLIGSLLSFLLSIGLHPYIELLLNDDSLIVLNELSNPNHPLLKKLLTEAPGTYHHSMMVASLSANAVAEIGGRSLLTRVACYYHDIGKIKHANFFVENLPAGAENPHNFLLPEDSKEIIFDHVTEGVKILKAEGMPQLVIDICQQHHGQTLMKYFFVKAQERNPEVKEEDFRYPGPKPQTREAGVVNIVDSAEAAVRAMDHPTNEKIREFVHNLVKSRIEDGQLDESGLTMNEIRMVEESLINGLCSTFHSRIKYPKMKSEAEQMKKEQEKRGD